MARRNESAYKRVNRVRTALSMGRDVLQAAADKASRERERKALDFCAGCLIELEQALTLDPRTVGGGRSGVNSGCGKSVP